MKIHIENLKFQCIIGILDFERIQKQDIIINLLIEYNYKSDFINYAQVVTLLQSTMIENKFSLIEDALLKLTQSLKDNFSTIDKLDLKITKPSIMPNCQVSVSHKQNFNS